MNRRDLLLRLALPLPWSLDPLCAAERVAAADAELVDRLRRGGVAVLLRHALTDPGIGDPPGFRPGVCDTQRNLSEAGRAQARRIGAWFAARGLQPSRVRSSAWCRCLDTGRLAFGRVEAWPALNSLFGDAAPRSQQTAALETALAALAGSDRFEVWVTHQINISALTGEGIAMGEACIAQAAPPPAAAAPARVHCAGRLGFGA